MLKDREGHLDPSQPSLVVTLGTTTRKVCPLDRALLVLGRAPQCDINLVSPEVANIHALISRTMDGWRVRDCGSRIGTRLNGKAIVESRLEDGDMLQIGVFSFQLNLPAQRVPGATHGPRRAAALLADPLLAPDVKKLRKLERSRRHLAELALSLRRRLRGLTQQTATLRQAERLVEERHAELARQREALRRQQREMKGKAAELLRLEQDVNQKFTALAHEIADFQQRQDQAKAEHSGDLSPLS